MPVSNQIFEDLNIEAVEQMFSINNYFSSIFYQSIPTTYLVDYATGKYMIMSKSSRFTVGYDPKEFIVNVLGSALDIHQGENFKPYNKNIFPDRLRILKRMPYREQPGCIFSFSFRV